MIDQTILVQIKEYALYVDWHLAFDGKAYGNQHLFRVVTIAQFLAEKEDARREICEAGAWLHDVALVAGNDDNPTVVRAIADRYLVELGLDDASRKSIAECVETHEGIGEAASLEAKIVHDADVLDKMGLLGVIRHTWKIVNLIDPDATTSEIFSRLRTHLRMRQERLYTDTAKHLVNALDQELRRFFANKASAIEMIEIVVHCARQAVISDKIARELLLNTDNRVLKHQLEISHKILEEWYAQSNTSREQNVSSEKEHSLDYLLSLLKV